MERFEVVLPESPAGQGVSGDVVRYEIRASRPEHGAGVNRKTGKAYAAGPRAFWTAALYRVTGTTETPVNTGELEHSFRLPGTDEYVPLHPAGVATAYRRYQKGCLAAASTGKHAHGTVLLALDGDGAVIGGACAIRKGAAVAESAPVSTKEDSPAAVDAATVAGIVAQVMAALAGPKGARKAGAK